MNKQERLKVIESLKDCYKFLVNDYGYEIIEEESSSDMFFYVRYENRSMQRIIPVGIDIREKEFSIIIWKSIDGSTTDKNMLDFKDYLKQKGIPDVILGLPDFNSDVNIIGGINKRNSEILKMYGVRLIQGEEGYSK